jgi:hypothetical protein
MTSNGMVRPRMGEYVVSARSRGTRSRQPPTFMVTNDPLGLFSRSFNIRSSPAHWTAVGKCSWRNSMALVRVVNFSISVKGANRVRVNDPSYRQWVRYVMSSVCCT